jgi:hypothetical protein
MFLSARRVTERVPNTKKATQARDFVFLIVRYHYPRTWHRSQFNGIEIGYLGSRLFVVDNVPPPPFFSVVLQGTLTILFLGN